MNFASFIEEIINENDLTRQERINLLKSMNQFDSPLTPLNIPPGYVSTTDRTKFQLGDIIFVKPTYNWPVYQSKRSSKYFDTIGRITGYKNVPGAYTKFAVQFPDGTVEGYHGHFLFGPFKSYEVAQLYLGSTREDLEDHGLPPNAFREGSRAYRKALKNQQTPLNI